MPEKYINSDGEAVEVTAMNNFHLVNALIKSAKEIATSEIPTQQQEINISVLKTEVLNRLNPENQA